MVRQDSRVLLGVLLILTGAFFFAINQFPGLLRIDTWWPAVVILPGAALLLTGLVAGIQNNGLKWAAVLGAVVTTVGLILLYGHITGRWHVWAYAWALIPASAGFALAVTGTGHAGSRLVAWSVLLFVIGGLFFEGMIFGGAMHMFWPVLLIIAGAMVLAFDKRA